MTTSINFSVLYAAAARLVTTKHHLTSNILQLLCRYESANTQEKAIDVGNKLLKVICEDYVANTEHLYYRSILIEGLEDMMVTPMHENAYTWLQAEYRYLINK